DEPFERAVSGAAARGGANDEPAVVMFAAAVEQLQVAAAHRLDGQPLFLGFGGDAQPAPARGEGGELVGLADRIAGAGTIGLARKNPGLRTEGKSLAEQEPRKKFEVEPDLADPGR